MLGRSASMRQTLHVAFVRGIAGADPVPRIERFEQREAPGLDELLRARSAGFSRAFCKTCAYHCSRARWSLRAISSLWHSSPCVECHTHLSRGVRWPARAWRYPKVFAHGVSRFDDFVTRAHSPGRATRLVTSEFRIGWSRVADVALCVRVI